MDAWNPTVVHPPRSTHRSIQVADVISSDRIFNLLTCNDELIGSLDWVSDEAWRRRPAEGEWSAAEIVGHLIELEPYWAREAGRLAANPGADVGRGLDDPIRLSGPVSGQALSAKEARTLLAQAGEAAAEMLRKIPDSGWGSSGTWRGTTMTVADLVEQHLTEHVRQHVDQAVAALEG
jgi:uncharacterized damage-inducible protein DinB